MCNCNLQPLDWDLGDSWGMIKLSHLFTYSNAHQSFHKKCGGMYRNQTPQLISWTVTTADILRMQTIFKRKLHIKWNSEYYLMRSLGTFFNLSSIIFLLVEIYRIKKGQALDLLHPMRSFSVARWHLKNLMPLPLFTVSSTSSGISGHYQHLSNTFWPLHTVVKWHQCDNIRYCHKNKHIGRGFFCFLFSNAPSRFEIFL